MYETPRYYVHKLQTSENIRFWSTLYMAEQLK